MFKVKPAYWKSIFIAAITILALTIGENWLAGFCAKIFGVPHVKYWMSGYKAYSVAIVAGTFITAAVTIAAYKVQSVFPANLPAGDHRKFFLGGVLAAMLAFEAFCAGACIVLAHDGLLAGIGSFAVFSLLGQIAVIILSVFAWAAYKLVMRVRLAQRKRLVDAIFIFLLIAAPLHLYLLQSPCCVRAYDNNTQTCLICDN